MKVCFKCKQEKSLSDFYAHPQMGDGHLNKCKECTKKDSNDHFNRRMLEPEWREKELCRQREKSMRQRLAEKKYETPEQRLSRLQSDRKKYPQHYKARTALGNAVRDKRIIRQPCMICGNPKSHGHHDDYLKPLDVLWLCRKHHGERHVQLRQIKEYGYPLPPF